MPLSRKSVDQILASGSGSLKEALKFNYLFNGILIIDNRRILGSGNARRMRIRIDAPKIFKNSFFYKIRFLKSIFLC